MNTNTMTNATPITRVWFASPQAADRRLSVGARTTYSTPVNKAFAVKDVAHFRSGRSPV